MTITDEAVEAHARARCRAMGLDPERLGPYDRPMWARYADHARLYLASRAAEKEMEN